MADKSKMAFGSSANLQQALTEGKIDKFDLLLLDGDTDKPKVGWIDRGGNPVIVHEEDEVIVVDALPETGVAGSIYVYGEDAYVWNGEKFVNLCKPTDVSELTEQLAALAEKDVAIEAEIATKANAEDVETSIEKAEADAVARYLSKKYEITDVPVGTLVNYGEKEIRVMAPANADWHLQSVGVGGDSNTYYMTFKTYAPSDDAVGYIEHLGDQVDAEVLTDLKTDKHGRKYQPTWLGMAKYNTDSSTWVYNGAESSVDHYIGWNYQIDWYNADGVMIASDSIRINLSNEECHYSIEPSYVGKMETKIEELETKIAEMGEIPVVEF